jgi:hypothetical protein
MRENKVIRLAWVVAAVTTVACGDKGSLGNYDEGSDSDSGGSTSDDATGTASMSSSASVSATASATGETTDTDPTMSTSANPTMTGGETDGLVCETDGNCVVFPAPCGESCGAVDSEFDESGCLRQKCSNGDACAEGERCFVAMDFGLCESSGTFCSDDPETGTCQCGGDADCNGGHCVPEDLYPAVMPGPEGDTIVEPTCQPDDGPAFSVTIYVAGEAEACDPSPDAARLLTLVFWEALAVGTFEFGATSGPGEGTANIDGEEPVGSATIEITEVGDTVSGSYQITLGGFDAPLRILAGELVAVPYCPAAGQCG